MFKTTDIRTATGMLIAGYLRQNLDNGPEQLTEDVRNKVLGEAVSAVVGEAQDWGEALPEDHEANLATRVAALKPHEHAQEMISLSGLEDSVAMLIHASYADDVKAGIHPGEVQRWHLDAARRAALVACEAMRSCSFAGDPLHFRKMMIDLEKEVLERAAAANPPAHTTSQAFDQVIVTNVNGAGHGSGGHYRGLDAATAPEEPARKPSATDADHGVVAALRALRASLAEQGRADDYGQHVNALLVEAGQDV